MKYIAYGSNMSRTQMQTRTPGAKLLGVGRINGMRLAFYNHATIEPSDEPGAYVPVALWEIESTSDWDNLDYYEGYPDYYSKEQMCVEMLDGDTHYGVVYIMDSKYKTKGSKPSKYYVHGIVDAYYDLGIGSQVDSQIIAALKRINENQ